MNNSIISPFWTRWLLGVSIIGTLLGIILFATSVIQQAAGSIYYEVFLGAGTYQTLGEAELRFQQFLYGVMGAVMAAWMLALAIIIHIPFRRGEKWAWYVVDASVVLWFIGDSYVSIVTGFSAHVLINVGFLVAVGLPLLMTFRQFHPRSMQSVYAEVR